MKDVAVIITVHQSTLSWWEEISLKQCKRVLSSHPVFLVYPKGLDVKNYLKIFPKVQLCPFPARNFKNLKTFNRFKIQPKLYKTFSQFEFLLFYELDSFVFEDNLLYWCRKGFDYIGAPWFEGFYESGENSKFIGIGNGGFSLRKTSSALRVSNSLRLIDKNFRIFGFKLNKWGIRSLFLFVMKRVMYRFFGNRFHFLFNRFADNDDIYWGIYASQRFKWWNHPDYDTARSFAFESQSPKLYRELGHLPFGCHKWHMIHKEFWMPIIESFGYDYPSEMNKYKNLKKNSY